MQLLLEDATFKRWMGGGLVINSVLSLWHVLV
jgi:hypothetical protein